MVGIKRALQARYKIYRKLVQCLLSLTDLYCISFHSDQGRIQPVRLGGGRFQ